MAEDVVRYYAFLDDDDATPDRPTGVFRRLRPTGYQDQSFGPDGMWHPTDWFIERDDRGTESGTVEPITPQQAAVVLRRWRDTGAVPAIEGVDLPPLPATGEPAPPPGAGPVDPAAAQAVADAWINAGLDPRQWVRAVVHEFDLGYLVYRPAPRHTDTARPPTDVGTGRGIIDKATGEISMWPSLPIDVVIDMYQRSKAGPAAAQDGGTDQGDSDGQ